MLQRLAGIALALTVGLANAAQTSWDMAVAYAPANYQTRAAEQFAAAVAATTKNAVTIKVQAGGVLGFKGPEMLGVVREGLVPVGTMLLNQQSGVEPLLGIASLPYLTTSLAEARVLNDRMRADYERIARKHNQKLLYVIPWPGQNIFAKDELQTGADFRKLKIRTVDRAGTDYFRSLGATPAQMPWGEVVPALATGVVNAVTTSTTTAVDGQFWDFLPRAYEVNWQINLDMVTVNLDAWNKLSPEHQRGIEEAAKKLEPSFWTLAAEEDAKQKKQLQDKGIRFVTASPALREYMRSKSVPAWDEYAKRVPEAKAVLDGYKAAAK
jgi:TRAP-type C4-dicarboxylate transport system substrate-binding protein